jgi:IMP dehydrogenase
MYRTELTYQDISLFSREISNIKSRFSNEINLNQTIKFGNDYLEVGPLMSAPMYDVTGLDLSVYLLNKNQLPIVHRFMTANEQIELFSETIRIVKDLKKIYSYTIGINDAEEKISKLDHFLNYFDEKLNILICIDTANGANRLLEKPILIVNNLKKKHSSHNIEIISGNIVTKEASKYLYDLGVKFQRVSISTGSVCSTSVVTGMFRPPVSAISEIYKFKKDNMLDDLYIVADGGFKENSDLIKAIAVGADFIMSGSLFAGYKESNSNILVKMNNYYNEIDIKEPDKKYEMLFKQTGYDIDNIGYYKYYRGMASQEMATLNNSVNKINKPILAEGISSYVEYKNDLNSAVDNILNSFKSACSYANSLSLEEFRDSIEVVEISNTALLQRRPHINTSF